MGFIVKRVNRKSGNPKDFRLIIAWTRCIIAFQYTKMSEISKTLGERKETRDTPEGINLLQILKQIKDHEHILHSKPLIHDQASCFTDSCYYFLYHFS